MSTGAITAEMLDGTRIRCGVIEIRHRTPIFTLARRLLAEGADPATMLTVLAPTGTTSMVQPLGRLAALEVLESSGGRRGFVRFVADTRFPLPESVATARAGPRPVSPHQVVAEAAGRANGDNA